MIDAFPDSIFDFDFCLSYILLVAFCSFYAIDQIGAIADYIVFHCVRYIASSVHSILQYLQSFLLQIFVFSVLSFSGLSSCVLSL